MLPVYRHFEKKIHTVFFSILCIKDKSLGWYIRYIYVNLTVTAWLLSFSFRSNCALIKGLRPRFLLKKGYGKKLDSGRMVWALGLWTPGFLDSGHLDYKRLDAWTLDDWMLVPWTLELWTLRRLDSGCLDIIIFNNFTFVIKEVL